CAATVPKTTRHTAHHHHRDDYPERVTIVRRHHPLEGQTLDIFAWSHRGGQLHLVLVRPDGTHSLMPAAWTDLHSPCTTDDRPATLASRAELLHMRTIVDALLRRLDASIDEAPSTQKGRDGATPISGLAREPDTAGERRPRMER